MDSLNSSQPIGYDREESWLAGSSVFTDLMNLLVRVIVNAEEVFPWTVLFLSWGNGV